MNNNYIKPCGLFHTYDSQEELMEYIERFSGGEKTAATIAMGLTWNLCSKLIDDQLKLEKENENTN